MICELCGHSESDHEFVDEDGHTEPSPCIASFGRFRICRCFNFVGVKVRREA